MKTELSVKKIIFITAIILTVITSCSFLSTYINTSAAGGITEDGMFSYIIKDGKAVLSLTEAVFGDDENAPCEELVIPGTVSGHTVGIVRFDILSGVSLNTVPVRKLVLDNVSFDFNYESEKAVPYLSMTQGVKNLITDITFMPNCRGEYFPRNYLLGFKSLTRVNIPEGITSLGAYSLFGCTSLKEIALPDSVLMFEAYCFDGCDSLERIYYNNEERIRSHAAAEQLGNSLSTVSIIPRKNINTCSISGIPDETVIENINDTVVFNDISVKDKENDADILISYRNNTGVGKGTVNICGLYEYCGAIEKTFSIIYNAPETPVPAPTQTPEPVKDDIVKPTPEIKYIYVTEKPKDVGGQLPTEKPDNISAPAAVKKISCKKIPSGKGKKNSVVLTWKYAKGNYRFYIYRKTGNGKYKKTGMITPYRKKAVFYDSGLRKNTTYTYKICAAYPDRDVHSKYKLKRVRF